MNLPNYFLADLPPEAHLGTQMLVEACQTLKRNRAQYLAIRPSENLIRTLAGVAEDWLADDYPFRQLALRDGPAATGFSLGTLTAGIDAFFKHVTPANLQLLLEQDLGEARRLDEPTSSPAEHRGRRAAVATGPEMIVHIAAGHLPNPTWMSMILGVLVRSAQFVKCASGASLLPRLFAHSLYERDPKLAACLEVAEWRGGKTALENAIFAEADCITATGSDETLAAIRHRVPPKARFLGYGHRVSFGFVANDGLSPLGLPHAVADAAKDVVAWDQLGCLSPHLFYVEKGGRITAEQFAEKLSEELERREQVCPRGRIPVETAAAIATRRGLYEVRAAHSPGTRHWYSQNSTAWTVIFEADPLFQLSCLNRFVYVKEVTNLTEALQAADRVRGQVSTVGLLAGEGRKRELVMELARWGVARVCPLGRMQDPPFNWRHDGRPALADLVTWTDWEQ
ncbi:acyl-CoA reductase [Verrucomicrobiota bacterium]|nr:acyl-CoA reductase [Verrucomicrobiota bacterium]